MTEQSDQGKPTIDLKELQEELQKAIDDDKRYWLENDAKFRAVNQGTATYDEFRDIVKAAHLRPVEGKDLKNLSTSHRGCIWNLVSESTISKSDDTNRSSSCTTKEEGSISKENFFRNFKRSSTDEERFSMLQEISVNSDVDRIFSSDIPIDVMNMIIRAMLTFEENSGCVSTVYLILKHLTNVQRFELGLEFLSSEEKGECGKLFDKLLAFTRNWQQEQVQLAVTECEIKLLREKYKV